MTQTTSASVFVPEVYADTAEAKFLGAVKVAGSPAVQEKSELEGGPGAAAQFPYWGALGELDDLTEGDAITPSGMSTANRSATIKEVGKGVEITDKARLVSLGDPEAEAARQFGVLAARKIDTDLIAAAQAVYVNAAPGAGEVLDPEVGSDESPLTHATVASGTSDVLSWSYLVDAFAKFGDEFDPEDFAGIYINSAQHVQLMKDANFLSADKLGQSGTPIAKGQIGSAGGVPVFVTDKVAAKKVLIVKKGALGLLYKQRFIVEHDRDILARADVITTTAHYAVRRLNDRGVCVLTLTNAV